jgi:hypothetical protein
MSKLRPLSITKMETENSSEALVNFKRSTCYHVLQDNNFRRRIESI